MTAIQKRTQPASGTAWPLRAASLTTALFLCVLSVPILGRAADPSGPPTSEDLNHYLDWYKQHGAYVPPSPENAGPTPEDIVNFKKWYRLFGAPKPAGSDEVPTASEVARFLEWYKHSGLPKPSGPVNNEAANDGVTPAEVARYLEGFKQQSAPSAPQPAPDAVAQAEPTTAEAARLREWYKHEGAPVPIAAPPPDSPVSAGGAEVARFQEGDRQVGPALAQPLPVVTAVDVQPISDRAVQPVSAQEPMRPVPPPPLRSLVKSDEQTPAPPPLPPVVVEAPPQPPQPSQPPLTPLEAMLSQVGCSSCGTAGGTLGPVGIAAGGMGPAPGGCACGSGNCVPGRKPCYPCESDNVVGRFLCGVYECICCPDPCYDPKWIPLADSAFFTDSARPQTQQRVRWDAGLGLTDPDIAEYFWARGDGKGSGPNPGNHANPAGFLGEQSVKYSEMSIYTEAALGNIGTFVEVPYRSLDGEVVGHAAGFGDMNLGTKTLLFDCELLQIALEFRTYLPIGDVSKGLGTGHVSLEPGLIVGLKLGPETYFQGQVSEWIPIGGDPDYEGALLEYHLSVNQLLCRILPDVPLVGTVEMNGWSFQHGQFTDPINGPEDATGITYLSMGPGLRLFICDKIDFGVGTAFAITSGHFADQLFRSELRWRF